MVLISVLEILQTRHWLEALLSPSVDHEMALGLWVIQEHFHCLHPFMYFRIPQETLTWSLVPKLVNNVTEL